MKRNAWSSGLHGFTLIEMVMVIVIVGIIAASAAVAIRSPVQAYLATVRRADLSDEADTSLRFLTRELKSALANSIRCDTAASPRRIEFLPIQSGGRYREYPQADGTGTPLLFGEPIAAFDALGKGQVDSAMTRDAKGRAVNGTVVVGNLSQDAANACSAYVGDNASALAGIDGVSGQVSVATATFANDCNLASATLVDNASTMDRNEENQRGAGRFFIVGDPVLYTCGSNGLLRYTGYTGNAGGVSPVPGVTPATLAARVTACEIACDRSNARVQTLSFLLTVAEEGDAVQLFRQVRVENLP